jgi:peptidylprolyl isomerase
MFIIVYKAVDYDTGEVFEERWENPWTFEFTPGELVSGLEKGLVGMKAGGSRELIVPSRLAYGDGALVYVVKVIKVSKLVA